MNIISDSYNLLLESLLGVLDSIRLDYLIQNFIQEKDLRKPFLKSFSFNLFYIITLLIFDKFGNLANYLGLNPLIISAMHFFWILFWALPAYLFGFIVSNTWNSNLISYSKNSIVSKFPILKDNQSVVSQIKKNIFFMLILNLFKLFTIILSLIPQTGYYLGFFLQCPLVSLYSFEGYWSRRNKDPKTLFNDVERNWVYHPAFGFLLTYFTYNLPLFYSLSLYSMLLPLLIIIAGRPEAYAWKNSHHKYIVFPTYISYFDTGRYLLKSLSKLESLIN